MFYLPAYRITPSAHPVKCPPQCPSHIHPHRPPSSPSITPSSFPWVRSLYVLSPFLIFPTHFFSLPLYSLYYYLYSPNEWEHTMFVLLWLTYFTQHNTFQLHPRWSKWWLFVVSNVWARPTCSLSSASESPKIWMLFFNKWLTSLRLSLWSITFLVFKASTWDCISVIAFLTLAWLGFSSFISTVRDSLVFFCALFPAQLLSL